MAAIPRFWQTGVVNDGNPETPHGAHNKGSAMLIGAWTTFLPDLRPDPAQFPD